MIKIENTEIVGWEAAIRGMRNRSSSWEYSDSHYCAGPACPEDAGTNLCKKECPYYKTIACENNISSPYLVGPKDLELMNRLRNSNRDNRKFMRMIVVYLDITAPLYWWTEFDAHKVGIVSDSDSLTYKIMNEEFILEDFSRENLTTQAKNTLGKIVDTLNGYRDIYINWDKQDGLIKRAFEYNYEQVWWQMVRLLPSSYNQHKTVMLNYEVLADIYKSERNRSLYEWRIFCDWITILPYHELITGQKGGYNYD